MEAAIAKHKDLIVRRMKKMGFVYTGGKLPVRYTLTEPSKLEFHCFIDCETMQHREPLFRAKVKIVNLQPVVILSFDEIKPPA